jgi:hypothetical protein
VRRREEPGGEDRRQADRTGTDDHHGVARPDVAVEHADLVRGGQDGREHDGRLVRDGRRQLVQRQVGERNAGVLRLYAVDQVPENPAATAETLTVAALSAVPARTAGRDARGEYAVAGALR